MANHVHLLVGVQGDPEPAALLRDFKSYASRALNSSYGKPLSGTWWTEQGSNRKVSDAAHFTNARRYVRDQAGALVVWDVDAGQGTDVPRSPYGVIGDTSLAAQGSELFDRVIFQCIIGSQAYGLADGESDIDRRGLYLPPADLHWSLYGVPRHARP